MDVEPSKAFKLLSPRLVAVITTLDEKGIVNAAPYSWVFPFGFDPSLVAVGSSKGKHTFDNALERGEFVVNLVSKDFAQKAVSLEKKHEIGENTLEKAGLNPVPSKAVKVPGIKESKVRIECVFEEVVKPKASDHDFVVGRVVAGFCEKLSENGAPDFDSLEILTHVSGPELREIGKAFFVERKK